MTLTVSIGAVFAHNLWGASRRLATSRIILIRIGLLILIVCVVCVLLLTCSGSDYSLLKNNCNSFSEDLCQFLCGTSIPKYILDLPQEFLSTPLGQSLGPLIGELSGLTSRS